MDNRRAVVLVLLRAVALRMGAKDGDIMNGCGKEYNGDYKVEGAPLRCGQNLYWKTDAARPQDRTLEVHLCPACREKVS